VDKTGLGGRVVRHVSARLRGARAAGSAASTLVEYIDVMDIVRRSHDDGNAD